MYSLIAILPARLRASASRRACSSRRSEFCTISRSSGSLILPSRSVSYWLNSAWNGISASTRSMTPLPLVSSVANSVRARVRRSSTPGLPGPSLLNGGSAILRYSSIVSLPSLLASRSSKVRMRNFTKSARLTSRFFAVSIS